MNRSSCCARSAIAIDRLRGTGMRFSKTLLVFALLLLSLGCQTLAKRNSTGVMVARRAQIRSSTAVVAADLLQVNRGDVVDILDSTDVNDPSDNTRKERWLRVKARDTDFDRRLDRGAQRHARRRARGVEEAGGGRQGRSGSGVRDNCARAPICGSLRIAVATKTS